MINGFKVCPICGKEDRLTATDETSFYKLEALNDTACINVQCNRCNVMVYDFTLEEKRYEKRLEMVRVKWNQLAHAEPETADNPGQTEEEGDKV